MNNTIVVRTARHVDKGGDLLNCYGMFTISDGYFSGMGLVETLILALN